MRSNNKKKPAWLGGIACGGLALTLAGCVVGPSYQPPGVSGPNQFYAALPHGGGVKDLKNWWAQFDDPLVAELVAAAEASSPTLVQAAARIRQARAGYASAESGKGPAVDANVKSGRGKTDPAIGAVTSTSSTVDASWEIDLFGAKRKASEAADARLTARNADWHDLRVSLAAEVANSLVTYRACEEMASLLKQDLSSREKTSVLTMQKVKAGFTAPSDGALIEASTAAARQQLISQRAECDLNIKALVALTDIAEPALRAKLGIRRNLPRPKEIAISTVPAQVLSQRPDIASAERELAAASADINVAEANRYPRISLLGSIGNTAVRAGSGNSNFGTWSFGPSLSLPLFDGGRRKADVDSSQGRYEEMLGLYQQKVRAAVREIEEALVRLDSAARRESDAQKAALNYGKFFKATEDQFGAGTGSLLDLEEARRSMLSARQTVIGVQRDRVSAWIALYKALGGGWSANSAVPAPKR